MTIHREEIRQQFIFFEKTERVTDEHGNVSTIPFLTWRFNDAGIAIANTSDNPSFSLPYVTEEDQRKVHSIIVVNRSLTNDPVALSEEVRFLEDCFLPPRVITGTVVDEEAKIAQERRNGDRLYRRRVKLCNQVTCPCTIFIHRTRY
jgi:hypothetical protein